MLRRIPYIERLVKILSTSHLYKSVQLHIVNVVEIALNRQFSEKGIDYFRDNIAMLGDLKLPIELCSLN
jgi:hypothetical protein